MPITTSDDDAVPARRAGRRRAVVVAVLLVAASIGYRVLISDANLSGFTDDDFVHLSRAQQIVFGELPVRDFAELGMPLTEAVSALAQVVMGRTLLSEFVLGTTLLGVAAGLLFLLAARASGSIAIGLVPALLLLLLEPRLYNYPKLLTYALAIPLLWRYLDRPSTARAAAVGGVVALAFLFRHDHGAYIGVAAAVTFAAAHWSRPRELARAAAVAAAVTLAGVAPYLLFVQRHQGVVEYLQAGVAWAERDAARTARGPQRIDIDWSAPLITVAPARIQVLPGVLAARNAVPFLFFLFSAVPVAALGVLLARRKAVTDPVGERWQAKVLVVVVLALLVNAGFLRGALPSRIPDVMIPAGVLAAWVTGHAWTPEWRAARMAALSVVALLGMLSFASAAALREIPRRLQSNGVAFQPSVLRAHLAGVRARLTAEPPVAAYASDPPDSLRLADYLRACTRPDDRVLLLTYAPELPVFAGRGFAGGLHALQPGFFESPEEQRLIVARVEAHRVPVVVSVPLQEYEEDYQPAFPLIDRFVTEQYGPVAEADPAAGLPYRVLARRDLAPTGTYEPLNLPCYQ